MYCVGQEPDPWLSCHHERFIISSPHHMRTVLPVTLYLCSLYPSVLKFWEAHQILHYLLITSDAGPLCTAPIISSINHAMNHLICAALAHLDIGRENHVRMQSVDYGSVFNTIISSRFMTKLENVGLNSTLCNRIFSSLTGRPQAVHVGSRVIPSHQQHRRPPVMCPKPLAVLPYT